MHAIGEIVAGQVGDSIEPGSSVIAAVAILTANLTMLLLFFAYDLSLIQLILVYWWEGLWIGLFAGLKLLTAAVFGSPFENRWVDVSPGSGLLLALFAITKSAGAYFTLLAISGFAIISAFAHLSGLPEHAVLQDQLGIIVPMSLFFLVGHGLSFVINFVLLGEFRHARIAALLSLPFRRSIGLLVALAVVVGLVAGFPGLLGTTSCAVLLITGKLLFDVVLHRSERRSLQPAPIDASEGRLAR